MKKVLKTSDPVPRYYRRLLDAYGPQRWWPAETRFEVIVGAILAQNTAWKNVERAVAGLKREGLLTPEGLRRVGLKRLAGTIRPSGCFNRKAAHLKAFVRFLYQEYRGDLRHMFGAPAEVLRFKLLSVRGIGPETADSILLYGGGRPVFVVDAYTRRVTDRHRLAPWGLSYHRLQRFFMDRLPPRADLFNEYHALLVKVGKEHCGRRPVCSGCPLEVFLNGRHPKI